MIIRLEGPPMVRGHQIVKRPILDSRGVMRNAASTSGMGCFETEWLTSPGNFVTLVDFSGAWIDRVHACRPAKLIVLDMDSPRRSPHHT